MHKKILNVQTNLPILQKEQNSKSINRKLEKRMNILFPFLGFYIRFFGFKPKEISLFSVLGTTIPSKGTKKKVTLPPLISRNEEDGREKEKPPPFYFYNINKNSYTINP